jgi:hypothetical protein
MAAALAVLAVAGAAHAADLYRWNDADGRVVYGDKPPKDARNVSRIEVDTATTVIPSAPASKAPATPAPAAGPEAAPAQPDLLTQRRTTRARLEENLARARARLDLARKNLAEATDMAPDEQQPVIEKVQDLPSPGAGTPSNSTVDPANMQLATGGMYGMAPRSNCSKIVGKSGKAAVVCPTIIPNEAYRERIAALEDAVRKAQADVDAAQEAYNRGVD